MATAIFFLFSALFSAQVKNNSVEVSSGVKYQFIGKYDISNLNDILTSGSKAFSDYSIIYAKPRNPVNLYRITYHSVIPELNNKPTVASGLLAIPENAKGTLPVLSYQHGTVFGKTDVPSFPDESLETRLILANFAGNGYIVMAADNFGKGISIEADAYQIKASTQQANLDMLFAGQAVLKIMNIKQGPLFLSGWSMGSWSTLMFLQKLQSLDIPVQAVALASTPNDIFSLINAWLHVPSKLDAQWLPALIALQLNAYSTFYDMPGLVQWGIKEEYQQAAIDYYQNKIDFTDFYKKTTGKVNEFLKPEFIKASSTGEGRYWDLLRKNAAYTFRSLTPVNVYYGEVDEALPVYVSTLFGDYQKMTGGAPVNTISAGKKGDHRGTYQFSIKESKIWFDTFLK